MSIESFLNEENFGGATSRIEELVASLPENSKSLMPLKSTFEYCATTLSNFALKLSEWLLQQVLLRRFLQSDEQIAIREILADHYQANERFNDLLRVLGTMPVEKGTRSAEPIYQFTLLTRIIQVKQQTDCWHLVDADLTKAIPLFRRLTTEQHRKHRDEIVQFLVCYAAHLDKKGKFLDAAHKYYDAFVKDDSLTWALTNAIVSALLADVGLGRSRILSTLHNDPRSKAHPLATVLDRAVHARRIRAQDKDMLKQHLQSQHKSMAATGSGTVAEVAIASHNMHAASKVYKDIFLEDLAHLLGIGTSREAETIASQLILSGAISASIDEVAGVVQFASTGRKDDGNDSRALRICESLETIATEIQVKHQ